ncbi:MAG: hypothetical protein IJE70_06955 [Oscillospiraceae bacterium]|nr:hypothetical protein [Oscillospiraceae bacterium]
MKADTSALNCRADVSALFFADIFGWTAVMVLLGCLSVIVVALLAVIYPKWKKFVREYHV